MQASEFNNILDGKAAKFAEMFNSDFDNGISGLLARAQSKQATPEDVEQAREEIKKQEVEIPGPLRFKIDIFVQQQKQKGKSDRNIRRAVQNKFKIAII